MARPTTAILACGILAVSVNGRTEPLPSFREAESHAVKPVKAVTSTNPSAVVDLLVRVFMHGSMTENEAMTAADQIRDEVRPTPCITERGARQWERVLAARTRSDLRRMRERAQLLLSTEAPVDDPDAAVDRTLLRSFASRESLPRCELEGTPADGNLPPRFFYELERVVSRDGRLQPSGVARDPFTGERLPAARWVHVIVDRLGVDGLLKNVMTAIDRGDVGEEQLGRAIGVVSTEVHGKLYLRLSGEWKRQPWVKNVGLVPGRTVGGQLRALMQVLGRGEAVTFSPYGGALVEDPYASPDLKAQLSRRIPPTRQISGD